MNKSLYILALMTTLVHVMPAYAQDDSIKAEPKFSIKGYIKYLEQVSFAGSATDLQTNELIHNRLNIRYQPNQYFNFRVEVRNRLYYGELVKNYPDFASIVTSSYAPLNLSKNWINKNAVLLNSTIDRATAEYINGKWDITIGRQRINWGINTVWTPNDIFNTFNYFDFDYEERPGTDALRMQYAFTTSSSIELDICPGKVKEQNIGAIMYHINKWNYDMQAFSGIYNKDFTAGVGWAGNIKDAGFKGEFSYYTPYGSYADSTSLVGSLSVDYGFKNGIYVLVSGLYNSLGKDNVFNIAQLSSETLSAKNMFPFKYTAFAQVAYPITPILRASLSTMYSPTCNSIVLLPTISYSIANNWALDFIGQSFFSQLSNSYQPIGNSVYMRIKWGF